MFPLEYKEVEFSEFDLIKMVRNLYPVDLGDAKIVVKKFMDSHGFVNTKVGANHLSQFISFMGLFTRKVLEVKNAEVVFCNPRRADNDDIFKALNEGIKTEI